MIHGHGGDSYLYEVKYDFSSNVIPKEYNNSLLEFINSMKFDLTIYPEPDADSLAKIFERLHNLHRKSTIVLNGSVEGIYLWAERFRGSKFLVIVPSFSEYEDAAKRFGSDLIFSSIDGIEDNIDRADCIILCNPNNPDGNLLQRDYLLNLVRKYSEKNFLIDEAYIDIVGESHSLIGEVQSFANLYVLRSMTKFFSLPGIRLGFLSFSPKNYSDIIEYKYPWSVNTVALEIGKVILNNYGRFYPDVERYKEVVKRFYSMLCQVDGLVVTESKTNYFLCRSNIKSGTLKDILLKENGILIRDASNFRNLDEYYFRVSAQNEVANMELVKALCSIIPNH
ncbi:MAG: aminotransferase class I/II-fold pyridoxal phosphate-dependent enzyme [Calditerrivibrio sp.]|nr:aminotransferase class I/II-fold pyridoxal phosphate-dependent enzyme [Calditerrivibrio sp.]MCA1932724.1 aminotransferase class I/II-fold pyridoxal phosphate-dependent enzyme [Calditerrivibrio sp.]